MKYEYCQREFARIFLQWRGPFLWGSVTENTHGGADRSAWVTSGSPLRLRDQQNSSFAWETSGSPPFAWATSGSLPSVLNYRPYIVFSSPMQKYEHPLRFTFFLFMASYWDLHTLVFFPVICWSYLRTEISVTLSSGNGFFTILLYFSLSCENTLLMLSCNCIESTKFIYVTVSILHLFSINIHSLYNLMDIFTKLNLKKTLENYMGCR